MVGMDVADIALLMTPVTIAAAVGRLWWLFKDFVWSS
jgi:hypothetical protein